MEIQKKDNGTKGAFYVEQDNQILAQMTYTWAGTGRIILDHTEVSQVLNGKGVGKKMVTKAVDFAREKGIKIIPFCPFAKKCI